MNREITLGLSILLMLLVSLTTQAQRFGLPHEVQRGLDFDILHYDIHLETYVPGDSLRGECAIVYERVKGSEDTIIFDLLDMHIVEIWNSGLGVSGYSYNDSLLKVSIPALSVGEKDTLYISYRGIPFHEQWGGWHTQAGVSFNLGVGFESIPHNLGKAWHPCFDNFFERATYNVSLTTSAGNVGVASGLLTGIDSLGGDTITQTWTLNQSIPTYLYGIAIGPYHALQDSITSGTDKIGATYYAKAGDTTRMRNLMLSVDEAMDIYLNRFGPYQWDRVGYVATPLGAMEHSTNIAIPLFAPETTVAHELAHHWWGNLVTCLTDRDMWINEGMAVFSEYVYLEDRYGIERRNNTMMSQLYQVVKNAHLTDGGYFPLSGVPRLHTYSSRHVYYRGGLLAHNLRTYMGYTDFYSGAKQFLLDNSFKALDSEDFRDGMQPYTGVSLNEFFNQWIFEPGLPDFIISAASSDASGSNYEVEVEVTQGKSGNRNYFTGVPLEIGFYSPNGQQYIDSLEVNKKAETFDFLVPFEPTVIRLNPRQKLNYAMTSKVDTIRNSGTVQTQHTDLTVRSSVLSDSAVTLVECHWSGPVIDTSNMRNLGVRPHKGRHWRFEGWASVGDTFTGRIAYDARSTAYDFGLIEYGEDSLVLLYRPSPNVPWAIHEDYTHLILNPNDSSGFFEIHHMPFGEYALAEFDPRSRTLELTEDIVPPRLSVYPNPTDGKVTLEIPKEFVDAYELNILSSLGELVWTSSGKDKEVSLDLTNWETGVYFYTLHSKGKLVDYGRIMRAGE